MTLRSSIDQMGAAVSFNFPPRRIISLVPSLSELLAHLGLSDQVKGITKFCVHPEDWYASKIQVGGTKHFDFNVIDSINPDLIIGNKEENYKEGISKLAEKYPVWMTDIHDLPEALEAIEMLGDITDRLSAARDLKIAIDRAFAELRIKPRKSVAYFIWRKPWMVAGRNTFIDSMLTRIGLENVVEAERYPEVDLELLVERRPDFVFLSSEPYPFKDRHIEEMQRRFEQSQVLLVDGEMFSWYGSRMLFAPAYFETLPIF